MNDCQRCGQALPEHCLYCAKWRDDWPNPDRNSGYCTDQCRNNAKYHRRQNRRKGQ